MRYLIDIKTKKGDEDLTKFMQELGAKNADYIDSYEPKEKLTREVEKLGQALREFKKTGISWNVFETYLRGRGHSQKLVDAVLLDVTGFFRKMGMLE